MNITFYCDFNNSLKTSKTRAMRTILWVVHLCGPCDAGDGGGLYELVADHFLLPEVLANLVDEDDVVGLSHGQLGGVRTEGESLHDVTPLAVLGVGRLGAELVPLLAGVVEEEDDPVGGTDGELHVVVGPGDGHDLGRSILDLLS